MTEKQKAIRNHRAQTSKYYFASEKEAAKYVEKMARQILNTHPDLDEFIMGMGTWFFTVKDKVESKILHEPPAYAKRLTDFIDKWDDYLKITGEPMRFTATGPKNTTF